MSSAGGPVWGKHLAAKPAEALVRFCSGRDVTVVPMADAELLPYDLWTNRAHAIMLHRQGILGREVLIGLLSALGALEADWRAGRFVLDPAREDVHSNVEAYVSQREGSEVGGRLHTGRSRNDQVVCDTRLFVREACLDLAESLHQLVTVLLDQARLHVETVIPGFSHMQPAMVTTWAHWLCSYAQALCRDLERLRLAVDLSGRNPLGAAAGFGTSWPIDRELTAELLAFDRVETNTLDAVGSRWELEWQVGTVYAAMMTHLSTVAQDLVQLSHPYWGMIALDDAYVTGSSIMPQKRNPDWAEVIRGKTAWIGGMTAGLLGVPKGGMSGYNRDTQVTKYLLLDIVRECQPAPVIVGSVIDTMTVDVEAMRVRTDQGYLAAADFADRLAQALALPFRSCYDIAAVAVRYAGKSGTITLAAAVRAVEEAGHPVDPLKTILADLTDPHRVVSWRNHTGAPAPEAVRRQIESLQAELERLTGYVGPLRKRIEAARQRCNDYAATELG